MKQQLTQQLRRVKSRAAPRVRWRGSLVSRSWHVWAGVTIAMPYLMTWLNTWLVLIRRTVWLGFGPGHRIHGLDCLAACFVTRVWRHMRIKKIPVPFRDTWGHVPTCFWMIFVPRFILFNSLHVDDSGFWFGPCVWWLIVLFEYYFILNKLQIIN